MTSLIQGATFEIWTLSRLGGLGTRRSTVHGPRVRLFAVSYKIATFGDK